MARTPISSRDMALASSMRHRITLESLSTTKGDGGRKVETYSPIASIWANIRPAHNPPQFRGNKVEYTVSHEITTRYAAEYLTARRMTFGVRKFDVHSHINVDEENHILVFRCEEIRN